MNDDVAVEPVQKLLGIVAEHLEQWLDGDELALERLGEALQEHGASGEQMQAAILTLRSLAGAPVDTGVGATRDASFDEGAADGELAH
ncbi:MAG: hypothetical protein HY076_05405 [Candidatus Eisenbacteria bacterium]|uniref:Uncharacterized protein n=1 Tax=Eiseniibacteriota bacterium TaxID=2212470 RepID=A0A9D6QJW6_UNCEI|nr:hypothetical protein [Candidatus Eisenbacteria bacterium]MBI3539690.1 hypothetical protein [Candidatus Eisenbacteria bacterium]